MDEMEALTAGPLVLMLYGGEGYIVIVDPALPTGNHRRGFGEKISAWHYAQSLWVAHRCGFSDQTTGNFGRIGTATSVSRR